MSEPMNAFERSAAALIYLTEATNVRALTPYDVEAASLHLHSVVRAAVDCAERACAEALPPVSARDLRNAQDPEVQREVESYRDRRYSAVDVSDLDDDYAAWEIVKGSSRYEVRTFPRYDVVHVGGAGNLDAWRVLDRSEDDTDADTFDAVEALGYDPDAVGWTEEQARALVAWLTDNAPGSDDPVYLVVDTNTLDDPPDYSPEGNDYDPDDEDAAREAAERANAEDYCNNANGWPFCHNYAYIIDAREADDFAAAGFVVACYKGDTYYAGIDGGGYSFLDAHWIPLYLARAAGLYGWPVRTSTGLRRVTSE